MGLIKMTFCLRVFLVLLSVGIASAQLSTNFYASSCPKVLTTIKSAVDSTVSKEARMGASLLRLHFHDCFVNVSRSSSFPSSCVKYRLLTQCIICECYLNRIPSVSNFMSIFTVHSTILSTLVVLKLTCMVLIFLVPMLAVFALTF